MALAESGWRVYAPAHAGSCLHVDDFSLVTRSCVMGRNRELRGTTWTAGRTRRNKPSLQVREIQRRTGVLLDRTERLASSLGKLAATVGTLNAHLRAGKVRSCKICDALHRLEIILPFPCIISPWIAHVVSFRCRHSQRSSGSALCIPLSCFDPTPAQSYHWCPGSTARPELCNATSEQEELVVRVINQLVTTDGCAPQEAVFAGRRSSDRLYLLLQNAFCAKALHGYAGTSSVYAVAHLDTALEQQGLSPAQRRETLGELHQILL